MSYIKLAISILLVSFLSQSAFANTAANEPEKKKSNYI